MTGIYKVDESNYDVQWKLSVIRVTVVFTIVYLLFVIVILAGNETDKISSLFTVTLAFIFFYVIIFVISLFIDQPSNRTIIEITDDQIIRSGKYFLTVRMKFKDIREIKSRPSGLILIKHGIEPTLNYYFSRDSLYSEFGIIFIPSNIDNYEQIKEFIERKHYG